MHPLIKAIIVCGTVGFLLTYWIYKAGESVTTGNRCTCSCAKCK